MEVPQTLYIFLSFTLGIFLCLYHWNRRHIYILASKCEGKFAWPIIGNLPDVGISLKDMPRNLNKLWDNCSNPIRVWFGQYLVIGTTDPDDAKIMLTNPNTQSKPVEFFGFFDSAIGESIFSAPVMKWRVHRKIINPTFHQKILVTYMDVFNERSVHYADIVLKEHLGKGEFDIFDSMCTCTMGMVMENLLGVRETEVLGPKFMKIFQRGMELIMDRVVSPLQQTDFLYKKLAPGKELFSNKAIVVNTVLEIIREKRALIEKKKHEQFEYDDSGRRKSFLDHLIEDTELNDDDITAEVLLFQIAGSDTSSTLTSFACLMLAVHPEIQERCYQELEEIFGDSDRPVTVDDLSRLQYTDRVLKEVMRLLPITFGLVRNTTEEITLTNNLIVPKGVILFVNLFLLHRDSNHYKNPKAFDPDHFLPEEVAQRHPYAYLPFSAGARNCIGFRYGTMSMLTILATVLRRYRLTSNIKKIDDIEYEWHVINKVVCGYPVTLHPRKP